MKETSTTQPPPWHQLQTEHVVQLLGVELHAGLPADEIRRRQAAYVPNRLTAQQRQSEWMRFLLQFHQPLLYLLLAASVLTLFFKEWVDAVVIFGVVLVNAIVGYVQEAKAERAIEALAQMVVTEATVRREGRKQRVASEALVPGDVVLLQSGDRVPADLRLFQVRDLQVDESALTGESVPVEKHADALALDTILAERKNLAFAGTLVTYGQAEGVVWGIGNQTETGRIARLITEATSLSTPLTRKIAQFSQVLLMAILALAAVTFLVGVVRGQPLVEIFMSSVALAVGAIPEGLPAAVTIVLAIGVARMARRRAIIRKLPAVETLGSTTVICSDKTGTLTENQMTVQQIYAGGNRFDVTGAGYEPHGEIHRNGEPTPLAAQVALRECLQAGLLCNDAQLARKEGRLTVQGDPTEGALIVAAAKGGLDDSEAARLWPRLDAIPFESEHQYMATLHAAPGNGKHVIYVKGAVERLLDGCVDALEEGGSLTTLDREDLHRAAEEMAAQGLRVLGFARRRVSTDQARLAHADVAGDLTFLGLQAMIDPPRAEAIAAVRHCQRAGVRVKMITGDGVNDAPALKQADIGVAMGLAGTDVAKGAADMMLTDDNFASIAAAVEEGRNVFDNLTKFIVWTLPTNFGQGFIILAAVLAGVTLPILPVQLLWVNMTTVILLGLMLVFESKERDLMQRPPRGPKTPIMTFPVVMRIGLVSALMLAGAFGLFVWEQAAHDASVAEARTIAVNVVVMVLVFYLLNCRSLTDSMFAVGVFSNRWIYAGIASMVAAQLLFTYAPIMNRLFHTAPISGQAWLRILAVAVAGYALVGIEKWIRRRWAMARADAGPAPAHNRSNTGGPS